MNLEHLEAMWKGERYDALTICHVTLDLARQLEGGNKGRVHFSYETLIKQRNHHGDLDYAEYLRMPQVVLDGEWLRDTPSGALILYEDGSEAEAHARAFVKATRKGELFLTSFARVNTGKLAQARRKPRDLIRPQRK